MIRKVINKLLVFLRVIIFFVLLLSIIAVGGWALEYIIVFFFPSVTEKTIASIYTLFWLVVGLASILLKHLRIHLKRKEKVIINRYLPKK